MEGDFHNKKTYTRVGNSILQEEVGFGGLKVCGLLGAGGSGFRLQASARFGLGFRV